MSDTTDVIADEESHTLICVVLRDAGGARVGWIRATRQGAPGGTGRVRER